MDGREKFEIYEAMYVMIPVLEKAIRAYYEKRGYKVYCVFLSVADEETRSFFADIEVGGSPEKYHHFRFTETTEYFRKKYL